MKQRSPYRKVHWIYMVQRGNGDIKIGYSFNFGQRLSQLTMQHGSLKVLGMLRGNRVRESELHEQFVKYRIPVEYGYRRGGHPYSEWFRESRELIQWIKENTEPYVNPCAIKYRTHHPARIQ